MFRREHHLRIATILQALDADLLRQHACLFGDGTAIALSHDEYRESVDIDFLISDLVGYQKLRQLVTEKGFSGILRQGLKVEVAKAVRVDQYGIRTMLKLLDVEIKFEIILEGRIQLDKPKAKKEICGVSVLSSLDMATCKLLANSDRWSDDSVFSRDLIDLAMLSLPPALLTQAVNKAKNAYGASVERDLAKAIDSLKKRNGRLDECMDALRIDDLPKALLWKRIRDLGKVIK